MPRDTRSTFDRSLYTFPECRPHSRVRNVHLSYAPHLILARFPFLPRLFFFLFRRRRIARTREYYTCLLFGGRRFSLSLSLFEESALFRFICIRSRRTVRERERWRGHGRSSNGRVQRTYSSNGACMHLIPRVVALVVVARAVPLYTALIRDRFLWRRTYRHGKYPVIYGGETIHLPRQPTNRGFGARDQECKLSLPLAQ